MIFGQVMGQKLLQKANYSIYGHTFFGHNSAIFGPIGLKFFMGTQGTIIYRLLLRNQCFGLYLPISIFWVLFGGKMGVAATPAPLGLGPQNPTKKLAHVGVLLGQLLSQNKVSKIYRLGPPLIIHKIVSGQYLSIL